MSNLTALIGLPLIGIRIGEVDRIICGKALHRELVEEVRANKYKDPSIVRVFIADIIILPRDWLPSNVWFAFNNEDKIILSGKL